jgi:hypothetical protein
MDFSKHTDGTTSVKVHHAPGGKSNFSLAWDEPKPVAPKTNPTPTTQPAPTNQPQVSAGQSSKPKAEETAKTSVKVHNPPGGKSNFTLG